MKFASFDSNRFVEEMVAKRVSRKTATEIASAISEALMLSETDLASRSDIQKMEAQIAEIHGAVKAIHVLQDEWFEVCVQMNSIKNELRAGHLAMVKKRSWLAVGMIVAFVLLVSVSLILIGHGMFWTSET